jgi:hypothetical protein
MENFDTAVNLRRKNTKGTALRWKSAHRAVGAFSEMAMLPRLLDDPARAVSAG